MRVERLQVRERLPDTYQLYGQAQLVRDGDGDAALRRAVELRQRDPGDADGLVEEPSLLEAVLARGCVDDQERLVGSAVEPRGDDPADLCQLLHEVHLRVQAAGSVDDHDVAPTRLRRLDRVVGDRRRVRATLGPDEVRPGALRPDLELLLRGRPERVCGRKDDRASVLAQMMSQLP